jgi:high affinity sulfate transporter 1
VHGDREKIIYIQTSTFCTLNNCGHVVAGSFSRSAVNFNAGVYTAMSNIIMAIVVLIVLLVLTPLFKYTPSCILSAIIISAVLSLIDLRAAWLIWKIDKFDFLACLGAFLGVFFVSVEIGLLIAVRNTYMITRFHNFLFEKFIQFLTMWA